MRPLFDLRAATAQALEYVSAQPDVEAVEVFASADANLTVRLNYTSHIPSNGVEEPKSTEAFGLGLRIVFNPGDDGQRRTGFGSEASDLSLQGTQSALDKARSGAVSDPEFVSLPKPGDLIPSPSSASGTADPDSHDPAVMNVDSIQLAETGWQMMDRALDAFGSSEDLVTMAGQPERIPELGLILGGDVVLLQSRMAIASTHLPQVQSEENTLVMSFATAMVERQNAKGSGWSVGGRLAEFDGQAAAEAARNAIRAAGLKYGGGQRTPTGEYRVILGPQPLAEILEWILMPGFHVEMFYAGASPFLGKLGQSVASEEISIYDDGPLQNPAGAVARPGTRRITDEGLPTGRTDLIRHGELSGLLCDYYNYQRIRHDPNARQKLGRDPSKVLAGLTPRNGFRPGNGGGRNFASAPSAIPTNLVVEGSNSVSHEELLRRVGEGVYIGRIWYTYPVNGVTSGDFSGTVIADSYLIKDGQLAAPLQPNTLRMNDNVHRVLNSIIGVGAHRRPTVRWSSDQITWTPEMAIDGFKLEEISEYMDNVYR